MPSGIGAQSVTGLAVKLAECSGLNSLPDSYLNRERIKLLFGDENESCRIEYYYLQLEVSDDKVTMHGLNKNDRPILYISSRDHMLGEEGKSSFANILDYAESISADAYGDSKENLGVYGKIRGLGETCPSKSGIGRWYGYDEYIINGGFEDVEVESLEYGKENAKIPAVPVQSAADIMMIHGHGAFDSINEQGELDPREPPVAGIDPYLRFSGDKKTYRPDYSNMPNKETWDANMERFMGTILHGCYEDKMVEQSPGEGLYQICPDFGSAAYGWGNFWWKVDNETRWLVLVSCTNMSEDNTAGSRPDKNWQKVVQDSYVKSVCGFSEIVVESNGFLRGSSNMLSNHAANLRSLIFFFDNRYEPNTACYLHEAYWADGCNYPDGCFTRDMSIAAWMEAAYETIIDSPNPKAFIKRTQIDSAAAVDTNYKWYIKGASEYAKTKDKRKLKIFKKPL